MSAPLTGSNVAEAGFITTAISAGFFLIWAAIAMLYNRKWDDKVYYARRWHTMLQLSFAFFFAIGNMLFWYLSYQGFLLNPFGSGVYNEFYLLAFFGALIGFPSWGLRQLAGHSRENWENVGDGLWFGVTVASSWVLVAFSAWASNLTVYLAVVGGAIALLTAVYWIEGAWTIWKLYGGGANLRFGSYIVYAAGMLVYVLCFLLGPTVGDVNGVSLVNISIGYLIGQLVISFWSHVLFWTVWNKDATLEMQRELSASDMMPSTQYDMSMASARKGGAATNWRAPSKMTKRT